MTRVLSVELYEWPFHNDTATCEDCGIEIQVPDLDDPNADFKAPHWRREDHFEPFNDVFEAICDECFGINISELLDEEDES